MVVVTTGPRHRRELPDPDAGAEEPGLVSRFFHTLSAEAAMTSARLRTPATSGLARFTATFRPECHGRIVRFKAGASPPAGVSPPAAPGPGCSGTREAYAKERQPVRFQFVPELSGSVISPGERV